MPENTIVLKNNMLALLREQKLSIKEFSEKWGKDYSQVHKIVTKPDVNHNETITMVEVAQLLGVSVVDLFEINGV